jgi:hypothetical protein
VKVISSSGSGAPASRTYTVRGGTTTAIEPQVPADAEDGYAVTVVRVSGGPVYGSRLLELPEGGVPMFTVQMLPDDRGTVAVPEAEEDLKLLTR